MDIRELSAADLDAVSAGMDPNYKFCWNGPAGKGTYPNYVTCTNSGPLGNAIVAAALNVLGSRPK
jgi:hypothetical protein